MTIKKIQMLIIHQIQMLQLILRQMKQDTVIRIAIIQLLKIILCMCMLKIRQNMNFSNFIDKCFAMMKFILKLKNKTLMSKWKLLMIMQINIQILIIKTKIKIPKHIIAKPNNYLRILVIQKAMRTIIKYKTIMVIIKTIMYNSILV
ncbi:hypothetical protein TTHERM_001308014 (macronuclear) [Tetrahymena thermophila SB210]|uniref:Uncharacterized protein n=1 Tax=Tetrahymena thermophila (strain SB210) TaxID=312017 RepID=W7XGM8_TETTS|nr:hypothetical protein TTHERM_001308014 [Tetrahymena thermophila SB210]EWS72099.1 hypothetical protein TTHERM_001308014 [Tetrahymena thermophila SB210]|eukprot:XP_012655365.1 hypothetical protein TTHERM_001308014 [Tetrahymena thermophila SB210]